MRSIPTVMRSFGLAVLSFPHLLAADQPDPRPVSAGGLEVSLNTSGYSFPKPSADPVPQQKRARASESKTSFVASVTVKNRSRSPIPFSFTDNASRWGFRIVDSNDQEVWWSTNSDTDPVEPTVDEVLAPGKAWKETARIPLVIDGQPLGLGTYSLQAFLKANKSVSASSVFEVVRPRGTQGIQGIVKLAVIVSPTASSPAGLEKTGSGSLVLASGSGTSTNSDSTPTIGSMVSISVGRMQSVPAQHATVRVVQLNARAGQTPFTWEGQTDEEGRFEVNTPPGQFRVSARDGSYPGYVIAYSAGAVTTINEITVKPNEFRPIVVFSSQSYAIPVIQQEPATN